MCSVYTAALSCGNGCLPSVFPCKVIGPEGALLSIVLPHHPSLERCRLQCSCIEILQRVMSLWVAGCLREADEGSAHLQPRCLGRTHLLSRAANRPAVPARANLRPAGCLSPHLIELMLCLNDPEAIIVASNAATGCAFWVQDVQLVCDAVEVAAMEQLPQGREAGQELLNEGCCSVFCFARSIDAGYCKRSSGESEVLSEQQSLADLWRTLTSAITAPGLKSIAPPLSSGAMAPI
jgi:hypothetical protein